MYFLLQRAKHVGLMQMIRSRDYNCIETLSVEKLVDVREDVGNFQSLRESTCFRSIVVADGDELRTAHLREQGEMRELRDSTSTDKSKAKI